MLWVVVNDDRIMLGGNFLKILIVDDEKLLVKGIRFNFEQDGYQVEVAYDGEEAIKLARDKSIDIIILDLMLPKIDGLTVCQKIREFSNIPIIMLTAKSEDIDKILLLSLLVKNKFIFCLL